MADNDTESETTAENPESPSDASTQTSISCSLGGLELEVECDTTEEAEALFERVWGERLAEAEEFSDALRERLVGHQ